MNKKSKTIADPATPPEPQEAPIPSRAVLLNRFASLQEKVSKLTDSLILTKDAMTRTATTLREAYGIIVSDSTHTTPRVLASSPVPTVQPPPPIEEDGEFAPVSDADNPMLRAVGQTQGVVHPPAASETASVGGASISRPTTVALGTKKSKQDKSDAEFAGDIAENMRRAVKQGLGK